MHKRNISVVISAHEDRIPRGGNLLLLKLGNFLGSSLAVREDNYCEKLAIFDSRLHPGLILDQMFPSLPEKRRGIIQGEVSL